MPKPKYSYTMTYELIACYENGPGKVTVEAYSGRQALWLACRALEKKHGIYEPGKETFNLHWLLNPKVVRGEQILLDLEEKPEVQQSLFRGAA